MPGVVMEIYWRTVFLWIPKQSKQQNKFPVAQICRRLTWVAASTCGCVVCSWVYGLVWKQDALTAAVMCAICWKEEKCAFQAEAMPLFWHSAVFSPSVHIRRLQVEEDMGSAPFLSGACLSTGLWRFTQGHGERARVRHPVAGILACDADGTAQLKPCFVRS